MRFGVLLNRTRGWGERLFSSDLSENFVPSLICVLCMLFCFGNSAWAAPETNNIVTKISYTNDLSLEMSLPAKVRQGEPLKLDLKLTNIGTNMVSFETENGVREGHLTIVDSKNSPPAMTKKGKQLLLEHKYPFSHSGEGLKPKEIHRFRPVDLNELFHLIAEKYLVSVTTEINSSTHPIHFSVTAEVEVVSARREGFLVQDANRKSGVKKLNGHDVWVEIKPATGSDTLSQLIFLIIKSPGDFVQNYTLKAQASNGANIPLKLGAGATVSYTQYVVYSVGADEKSEIARVIVEWDKESETFEILSPGGNL